MKYINLWVVFVLTGCAGSNPIWTTAIECMCSFAVACILDRVFGSMFSRYFERLRVERLQRLLSIRYARYTSIRNAYDCGGQLAEFMGPRLMAARLDCNKVIRQLQKLDPHNAPNEITEI